MNTELLSPGPAEQTQAILGDDRALLKRLARACRSGVVSIEADMKRLQHIHSPVLSQADGNQWLLAMAVFLGGLWWAADWRWAAAAAPLSVAIYFTFGRRAIRRRLMNRVDLRLDDPAAWGKLWEFGGLVLREEASGRRCMASNEDWRDFARLLPIDGEMRI
ncbi:MAG TPA: hypothetical protein VED46_18365 [Alphaproteobacteria bacterium]|nr:hypothetical protein [Alphaproteobacteria bacterium]